MDMIYHILLKPDLFLRNLIEDAFLLLNAYDITITNCALIRPNTKLLHCMYSNGFKWEFDYYSHNMRLYALGPSLSLICNIDQERLNAIRSIKGSALPSKLQDGSLRTFLKVKDRSINAIHMADTVELSNQELSCIYHIANDNSQNGQIMTYKDVADKLLSHVITVYAPQKKEVTGQMVLENILLRIHYYLDTCIRLNGGGLENKRISSLTQLENITKQAIDVYLQPECSYKIRFFDFFWNVLNDNMIYYSEFEKYYIQSGIIYSNANGAS